MAKNQYIDLDLNFGLHPVHKDVSKLVDAAAVKQALKNLIKTNFFERPFQPNLGCGVYNLLFEPSGVATTIAIERVIREAITNYEPRVDLRKVDVVLSNDGHEYDITIYFTILDQQNPLQLNVILSRLR